MSEFLISPDGVVLELVPDLGCGNCHFGTLSDGTCLRYIGEDNRCTRPSRKGSHAWMEVKDERVPDNT